MGKFLPGSCTAIDSSWKRRCRILFLDCCLSPSPSFSSRDWGTTSSRTSLTPCLLILVPIRPLCFSLNIKVGTNQGTREKSNMTTFFLDEGVRHFAPTTYPILWVVSTSSYAFLAGWAQKLVLKFYSCSTLINLWNAGAAAAAAGAKEKCGNVSWRDAELHRLLKHGWLHCTACSLRMCFAIERWLHRVDGQDLKKIIWCYSSYS